MAAEPLESLTLFDYSDRELLYIVLDETSTETGYAKTADVAKAIGITGKHPHQSVGSRLGYLRSKGLLASRGAGTQSWAVTQIGEDLINGTLRAPQARAVEEASPGELLLITRRMTQVTQRQGLPAGTLIRREWRRGTA